MLTCASCLTRWLDEPELLKHRCVSWRVRVIRVLRWFAILPYRSVSLRTDGRRGAIRYLRERRFTFPRVVRGYWRRWSGYRKEGP